VIWDFAGQPLPEQLRGDVLRAAAEVERGELHDALRELISATELTALQRRLRAALSRGWVLPEPTSAWSLPWPPV
jgi:hypothetical protein